MFKPGDLAWHKRCAVVVEIIGFSEKHKDFTSTCGERRRHRPGLHIKTMGSPLTDDKFGLMFMEGLCASDRLVPLRYSEDKDKADVLVSPIKEEKNA